LLAKLKRWTQEEKQFFFGAQHIKSCDKEDKGGGGKKASSAKKSKHTMLNKVKGKAETQKKEEIAETTRSKGAVFRKRKWRFVK